jgi:hypothetical protein
MQVAQWGPTLHLIEVAAEAAPVQPATQGSTPGMAVLDCNLASPGPQYIMQVVAVVAHTFHLVAWVAWVAEATGPKTILLLATELPIPVAVVVAQDIRVPLVVAVARVLLSFATLTNLVLQLQQLVTQLTQLPADIGYISLLPVVV